MVFSISAQVVVILLTWIKMRWTKDMRRALRDANSEGGSNSSVFILVMRDGEQLAVTSFAFPLIFNLVESRRSVIRLVS